MASSEQRISLARLRRSRAMQMGLLVAAISLVLARVALNSAGAVAPSNEHFEYTWARVDQPVLEGVVSRTWVYGPEAISEEIDEPYAESPGGTRAVQYFDKARMEINDPNAAVVYPWFVTTGRLADELMTGMLQIGDNMFEAREPADIPVAGDVTDPNGVTYRTFGMFKVTPSPPEGTVYTQRLARDGTLTNDPALSAYNVTAGFLDPVTNQRIATPFWEFMNSTGIVFDNGLTFEAPLFENPFYATGRPLTPAFWVQALVAGEPRDVLAQCFERRCLTYTPGNDPGWQVEAGNVGLHYWIWRYETPGPEPTATPTASAPATSTAVPTGTATPTGTAMATATPTSTPADPDAPVDVVVSASIDCDGDGGAESVARNVGAEGVCPAFLAGEPSTLLEGNAEAANEVQQLGPNDATGGTFSISFDHPDFIDTIIVTGIPFDANANVIEAALIMGFGASGVPADAPTVAPVSSDPGAQINETTMTFTFENGELAGRDVPQLVVDNTPLVGETVAGLFTTVADGAQAQNEVQQLTSNNAGSGVFALQFTHPSAGAIMTDPLNYNATAAAVQNEVDEAFSEAGVGGDAPTVSGGPANADILTFTYENGTLAGIDVPQLEVANVALTTTISVSTVEVFNANDSLIRTWLVTGAGTAQGTLDPGEYTFTFSYLEESGEGATATTGLVTVDATTNQFQLIASMSYGEEPE